MPQLPERCLSRRAGIVRCCPNTDFIADCRQKDLHPCTVLCLGWRSLVYLCVPCVTAKLFRRQQFNSTGGAQAVCAQIQELFHVLNGGNAAGCLDLAAAAHAAGKQLNIMEGCTCGRKARAGLDEVGTGFHHDIAHGMRRPIVTYCAP